LLLKPDVELGHHHLSQLFPMLMNGDSCFLISNTEVTFLD